MANIYDMVDTWNNGATTFTAIKMNVTDTASAAGSLLMDLQVGGVSKEKTDKTGNKTISGRLTFGGSLNALRADAGASVLDSDSGSAAFVSRADFSFVPEAASLGWGNTGSFTRDLSLFRDAANTLAQRNGTAAQAFRLYNTFTDASNYERAFCQWNFFGNGHLVFGVQKAGTGTNRIFYIANETSEQIIFRTSATNRWSIAAAGTLFAEADNTYDIGASGANRPRSLYLGTGLGGKSGAAAPTASDIPASQWMLWKNTTDASVKLYYNDAGTLKSVALT